MSDLECGWVVEEDLWRMWITHRPGTKPTLPSGGIKRRLAMWATVERHGWRTNQKITPNLVLAVMKRGSTESVPQRPVLLDNLVRA